MPIRQKLSRIEAKPKKVLLSPTFRDPAGIAQNDDFAGKIDLIRTCIVNGTPLPSGYYSKGAGMRSYPMLMNFGIMHLHLGRWNTDELLWLVQYPEHVVFLELSDHEPFDQQPIGERFHRYHSGGILTREKEIDAAAAAAIAAGRGSPTATRFGWALSSGRRSRSEAHDSRPIVGSGRSRRSFGHGPYPSRLRHSHGQADCLWALTSAALC